MLDRTEPHVRRSADPPATQSGPALEPIPARTNEEPDSFGSLISEIPDSQEIPAAPHAEASSNAAQSAAQADPGACFVDSLPISFPVEIHPPKPPVSSGPFKTHITPTLLMLTERLKPAKTYIPTFQTRALDPLERGYWFVRFDLTADHAGRDRGALDGPTWPYALFDAFWSFLSDFIGRDGRAGWGVWCILERDGDSRPSQVTLKVYAWGEVAMHIYLLLFLASERRIRGMGAQWKDSRDEVVVQMP